MGEETDEERLGSVGEVGDGPGGYFTVDAVYVSPSDSIYVMDTRLGSGLLRLVEYDPIDFTYVRQIHYQVNKNWGAATSAVGVSDHGPIIRRSTIILPETVGKPRHSYAVLTSWSGERIRELARLPGREMYFSLSPDGDLFVKPIEFARYPAFGLSAS